MSLSSSEEKFAEDFKPTFSASKLAEMCSPNTSESTRLKFLLNFRPFSDVKAERTLPVKKKDIYKPKVLLSEAEKSEIKRHLDETLDFEELKFDDEKIIESFNEKLRIEEHDTSLDFLMSKLVLTDDEEGKESAESAYVTAQSDEECFKKNCDKSISIETKSKQAVRYISNMRGRKMEKHILEKINKSYEGYSFVQNKSKKYVDYGNFKIVGIIDGMSSGEKTILEIKTRKNFQHNGETITRRERLQAMTYMNMFACERCLFVESGPNGEIKETMLYYSDEDFKSDVIDKLNEFTLFARTFNKEKFMNLLIKYNNF